MSASKGGSRDDSPGLSRRGFLSSVGASAVTAALPVHLPAAPPPPQVVPPGEVTRVVLKINGRAYPVLVEPRWSLVHVLREVLGLTAAKEGCGRGECGACTVLADGKPRYACLTLAVEAEGMEITTLEGLMDGEELGATQQAFAEADGFQCGYCTPGQIMAAEGLLRANPQPTPEQVRKGLSGNLCRCGAYVNIFAAVERAAELRKGAGGDV
ncbi:MAG TPA: (2Fe-2S)-binding protein [Longimicrobiales bacterium]|nr:(2Fe-2S)-binding protein [Longimicrobiales bacterium]